MHCKPSGLYLEEMMKDVYLYFLHLDSCAELILQEKLFNINTVISGWC